MKTDKQKAKSNQTTVESWLKSCRKLVSRIESARRAVVAEFQGAFRPQDHLLELTLNEAEALAWQTEYPHLVFPALATEKLQSLALWARRQEILRPAGQLRALAA
jgi:hypothetical protein